MSDQALETLTRQYHAEPSEELAEAIRAHRKRTTEIQATDHVRLSGAEFVGNWCVLIAHTTVEGRSYVLGRLGSGIEQETVPKWSSPR
jgi:hypothetical protein